MKKTLSLATVSIMGSIFVFTACSSGENFQSKMERYTPRTASKNLVPEIKSFNMAFKNSKSRNPASENSGVEVTPINVTNKKLYFLSLIEQYETLKSYSLNFDGPKINLCPNFHTGLLTHYEKVGIKESSQQIKNFKYNMAEIKNDKYISLHPELYLPLTKEATTPRVIDLIKDKNEVSSEYVTNLVQKAINIHLTKTYYELSELCEYGSSDNYYIYENMITHSKSTNFNASTENLNVLLKSTVFANMALINSLEKQSARNPGRKIASVKEIENLYAKDLFNKFNANWAKEYFAELKN